MRTVTRATPSNSTSEATWVWQVGEKWYCHDTESGQQMMTGPASTDAPIMRLIDRDGDGDFDGPNEEQHFVNDHQGSTVLVTGKATLDSEGNLTSRAPIIAHVKYDQYGTPKFVHPADANSDGVVDAADTQHWLNAWREYRTHNSTSEPPSEIWKGTVDSNESGVVDESTDGADPTQPSATNTDWVAFQAQYAAATVGNPPTLAEQLGNLPLYAGYWWDDAIGLYHVRHRVYRPEWGRWLQRDPLGYAPGWNLYQYVNGMPWRAVDPMGLWSVGDFMSDLASEAWRRTKQFAQSIKSLADTVAKTTIVHLGYATGRASEEDLMKASPLYQLAYLSELNDTSAVGMIYDGTVESTGDLLYRLGTGDLDAISDALYGFSEAVLSGSLSRATRTVNSSIGAARSASSECSTASRLFSQGPRGSTPASDSPLLRMKQHKRDIVIANPGSDELRLLDAFDANADVGGETLTHIILRKDARKIEAIEEFLHGTQFKLGMLNNRTRIEVAHAELHVKQFMIRHAKMLGLSEADVTALRQMLGPHGR